MIGPISQERFEKRCPGLPNPEIIVRRWYENSADKTLGFVAFSPRLGSWASAVFKRRQGRYKVWRSAAALGTEQEAVDTLFQLFGLTDLGYRERLAEREFFGQPGDRMEFLFNSEWGFDPGYDQATKARLDAPVEALSQKYFAEVYPTLLAHLEAEQEQKTACSLAAFATGCTALDEPVLAATYLIVGRDGQPWLRIYVGRKEFIQTNYNAIAGHLREISKRPGMRMLGLEEFNP